MNQSSRINRTIQIFETRISASCTTLAFRHRDKVKTACELEGLKIILITCQIVNGYAYTVCFLEFTFSACSVSVIHGHVVTAGRPKVVLIGVYLVKIQEQLWEVSNVSCYLNGITRSRGHWSDWHFFTRFMSFEIPVLFCWELASSFKIVPIGSVTVT